MILLTGASGFVGSAFAQALVRSGHRVRVLSRKSTPMRVSAPKASCEEVTADLEQPATLPVALDGIETVVHLAGALEGATPERMRAINVDGSRNLAIAAREAGVKLMLHVSSAAVYGDRRGMVLLKESDALEPESPYGISKLEGERSVRRVLEESKVGLIVLRPTGVYGGARRATQDLLREVLERRVWVHLPPQVIVHPTYLDDLVECMARAIERPQLAGQVINVGGERPVAYESWIAAAGVALGRPARQWVVPAPLVTGPARIATAAAARLGAVIPSRLARASERRISRAVDLTRARELLKFEPTPMQLGLERTVAQAVECGAIRR